MQAIYSNANSELIVTYITVLFLLLINASNCIVGIMSLTTDYHVSS